MNTNYKEIRAVYNEKTIRVYQAFNAQIADEAIAKGTFGSHFSMNRMSWIKPSFLWMMYRCGWCEKENQEQTLQVSCIIIYSIITDELLLFRLAAMCV